MALYTGSPAAGSRRPLLHRSPPCPAAWLPGRRDCSTLMAHKKGTEGLPGIISCMAPNPDRSGMLAVGSYSGGAALLDARTRELLCLLEGGHTGGLTHVSQPAAPQPPQPIALTQRAYQPVRQPRGHCTRTAPSPATVTAPPWPALPCPALPCPLPAAYPHLCWRPSVPNLLQLQLCFSADGNFLYTGARKDAAIRCWDVRYSSGAGRAVDGLCGCVGCCGCWDACYNSGALLAAAAVRCSQQQPDLRPLRQYTSAPPSPAASLSLVALFSSSCSVFLQAWCTALRGRAGAPTSACTST